MRNTLIAGLGLVLLGACHGANCAEQDQSGLIIQPGGGQAAEAERVALDEIYERFPSRALVDVVATKRISVSPPTYETRVEMTGSEDVRAVYLIEVTEDLEDELKVSRFTKVQ